MHLQAANGTDVSAKQASEGLPKPVDETLIPLRALLLELLSFDQIYYHTHSIVHRTRT
jgi:hypothetical protein